jgi:hypothetical protein
MNKSIIALLACGLIFAGCSQKPAQSSKSGSTSAAKTSSTAGAERDLCALLSPADLESILGSPVVTKKGNLPQGPAVTGCQYLNNEQGTNASIVANFDNEGITAKAGYEEAVGYLKDNKMDNMQARIVADVGEENYSWSTGLATQINAYEKNVWVSVSTYTGKRYDFDATAAVTRLALQRLTQ